MPSWAPADATGANAAQPSADQADREIAGFTDSEPAGSADVDEAQIDDAQIDDAQIDDDLLTLSEAPPAKRRNYRKPLLIGVAAAVALITAGAGTVAALTKSVTITVDGQQQQITTLAGTVDGALSAAGITVADHDTLAPAKGSDIADGSKISLERGRLLTLTIDGQQRESGRPPPPLTRRWPNSAATRPTSSSPPTAAGPSRSLVWPSTPRPCTRSPSPTELRRRPRSPALPRP